MATYQGIDWIAPQVKSILRQEGVEVRLYVSDDGSTDGTVEWVADLARRDPRVTLLPAREGEAGVGPNFLYALSCLRPAVGEFVALSDQDDLWHKTKLADQIEFLHLTGSDAVSSNVVSFSIDEDGTVKKRVIHKDYPLAKWDFIFEAPGAGSTFLLARAAWVVVTEYLKNHGDEGVWLHDWFIYALVRSAGLKWSIDARPHVAYRQHSGNALGAHRGVKAITARLGNLRSGVYRDQFELVARASRQVGVESGQSKQWLDDLAKMQSLLADTSLVGRFGIVMRANQIRRRPLDKVTLSAACLLGVW